MRPPPANLVASALDPRSDVGRGQLTAALDGPVEVREVVPGEAMADRYVAPGGWRRGLVGFLIGLLAGGVVALLLPRDDGPRRRDLRATGSPDAPVAAAPAVDGTAEAAVDGAADAAVGAPGAAATD